MGYWSSLHDQLTGLALVGTEVVQWLSECGQSTVLAMVWAVVEYCAFVFEWRMLVFVWELVAQWFSQHEQLTVLALAWAGVEQRLSVYEQKKAVALGEV